jgi:hypothetical protein
MSNTDDNIQITSSSPSGATIGTDYISSGQVHIQEVKINTGDDGVDSLMTDATPLITRPTYSSGIFFPVAGSTDGTDPVIVSISGGSIEASNVQISGGTIDQIANGVSADIRTVAAGITMAVTTIGQTNKVAITGDVALLPSTNNIGDVDVLTVAIPAASGVTCFGFTADATGATFPSLTFETGFRVYNYGTNTVIVGPTMASGFATHGMPLQAYDSIFIEAAGCSEMYAITTGGTTDIRVIGS